ncbi:MAG TPA: hypothetical protein VFS60_03335 [Thermoanaerobaculia bacterium]|nr:hypothetical protein [Thermoanaerobaculia bacterium]
MKREDLVRLGRTQIRAAFVVLVVFLVGIGLSMSGYLERIRPGWSPDVVMAAIGAFAIVLVVGVAMRGIVGMPKCPHCKRYLTSWLLHIAIATGNCGYCGKSIEE